MIVSCATTGKLARNYDLSDTVVMNTRYQKPIIFIAYGDSRSSLLVTKRLEPYRNFSWLWIAFPIPLVDLGVSALFSMPDIVTGDPGYGGRERRMMRDAVFGEAQESKASFVLHLGDIVYKGLKPKHWERFVAENGKHINEARTKSIGYFTAIGNHEHTNDTTGWHNFKKVFGVPENTKQYRTQFVIDSPDVAIFVLDSNLIIAQGDHLMGDSLQAEYTRQLDWLKAEMRKRPDAQKIVCMHHPPISFAWHHGDWSSHRALDKRRALIDLFKENDVRLVLCSHDHLFEYSQLDYDVMGQKKTMHFIISGGGGVPLRKALSEAKHEEYVDQYKRKEGYTVRLVSFKSAFNFCRVTIEPEKIHVQVVEVAKDSGKRTVMKDINIP